MSGDNTDTRVIDIIKDFNNIRKEERSLLDSVLNFKETTMFFGLMKRQPWAKHFQLKVELVEGDSDIIFDEQEGDLLFLKLRKYTNQDKRVGEEIEGAVIENFMINNYTFPFSVWLKPHVFKDYTNLDNDSVSLLFRVISQSKEGGNLQEKHFIRLNYQLKKYTPVPNAKFVLSDEFINGFEHRKDEKVLLGYLEVENNSEYQYAYDLSFKVKVIDKDRGKSGIYFFGNVEEYEQTNPKYDVSAGLRLANEQSRPILSAYLISADELQVDRHNAQNTLKIPVYVNINTLPNPMSEDIHHLSFSFSYTIDNRTNYHSFDESFTLLKDTRTTALMTFLDISGQNYLLSENTFDTQRKYQWIQDQNGWLRCFKIRLGNFAENTTDTQGAIKILNLNISFDEDSTSPSSIVIKEGKGLNDVFQIENYTSKEFLFPDSKDSFIDFDIRLRHSLIEDIPKDRLFLNCKLSFDYMIIENFSAGNDAQTLPTEVDTQHFETKVFFELEKYPGPYWLAVDFGTSAIVTAGSAGDEQEVVIDLQNSLKNKLKAENREDSYEQENVEEYDTTFLSSTLMLRDDGRLKADEAVQEVLALSPLVREVQDDRLLPYIKSLIGTKTIPNFKNRYSSFKYFDENGTLRNYDEYPIATNKLLNRAYDIMFKYYIVPEIIEKGKYDELNKLILTVPNSFTPRHLSEIRNIIHSNYPNFKRQYLSFVTESDAVASFYLKNWHKLNIDRPEEQRNNLFADEEYTLVYDMGAGTLDLTYFRTKTYPNNDKKVTIIGRLGSTIAGNYLDYVIAKWVYNKYEDNFSGNVLTPETAVEYSNALDLKSCIRKIVKPQLNTENDITLEGDFITGQGKLTIDDMSDFFTSPDFQEYLSKNSDDILKNLFSLACPQEFLQQNVRVDTVIFSGRGVQVANLKDKVKNSLQTCANNQDIYYIELPTKDLKSAVVEGALQYALLYKQGGSRVSFETNNLQAKYGVLYRNPANNQWAFREMLNPSTEPVSKTPIYVDGNMIYEYDTDIHCADDSEGYRVPRPLTVDFSATATGFFIQTFSLDPAKDANEGNFEFISKMMSISRTIFSTEQVRSVPFRVVVTKTNTMKIYYGDYENDDTDPLVVDPENDKTFIRSMWPLITE